MCGLIVLSHPSPCRQSGGVPHIASSAMGRDDGSQSDVDGGLELFAADTGRGVDGVALAERHHESRQRPGVYVREVPFPRRTGQPFFESGLSGSAAGGQDLGDPGVLGRAGQTSLDRKATIWPPGPGTGLSPSPIPVVTASRPSSGRCADPRRHASLA